jgi:putative glutamine amidotransferase
LVYGLESRRAKRVLGMCMGIQLMAMHAGGRLNQHLPDTLGDAAAEAHQKDHRHGVVLRVDDTAVVNPKTEGRGPKAEASCECTVASWHHQAVEDTGTLRLVATAPDGVIEAIDDPTRPFYVGVQWHPERGGAGPFNRDLLERFVDACRRSRAGS